MPLQSDLTLNAIKFDPSQITQQTRQLDDRLIKSTESEPRWYEIGAENYRKMRMAGDSPMPKPILLPSAKVFTLPSRDSNRPIPCRMFVPETGASKGVFYHIHGGGWVLQNEASQDQMLNYLADHTQLTVISVGYRLAPEHPYPAPNEDCFDVADWLVDNAEKYYGGPLQFIIGDSAGGHLSSLTLYHLLEWRPEFALKGIVLNFGVYNTAELFPQARNFKLELLLTGDIMDKYIEAYLPDTTPDQRRDKWMSPFYADLTKLKLPPALFNCGTLDCLLDDSVLMSTKWAMSGAESILKLYPGAPHGFVFFEIGQTEETLNALENIVTFVEDRL